MGNKSQRKRQQERRRAHANRTSATYDLRQVELEAQNKLNAARQAGR